MHSAMLQRRLVGIKKVGKGTSLFWKPSERKGEGQRYFGKDLGGKVKNIAQARMDLWEVWAAPLAAWLKICREKAEGGAEGIATHCSVEELRYMQEDALVW